MNSIEKEKINWDKMLVRDIVEGRKKNEKWRDNFINNQSLYFNGEKGVNLSVVLQLQVTTNGDE